MNLARGIAEMERSSPSLARVIVRELASKGMLTLPQEIGDAEDPITVMAAKLAEANKVRDERITALWEYAYTAHWWAEANVAELRDAQETREDARSAMLRAEAALLETGVDLGDGFKDGLALLDGKEE